jgi:hypothetical protein
MKIIRIISYFILLFACLVFGLIGFLNKSKTVIENNTEINILCLMSEEEKDESEMIISNKESKVLIILKNNVITNNIYTQSYTYLSEETYNNAKEKVVPTSNENYTFDDETFTIKNTSTFNLNTFDDIVINQINIEDELVSIGYTCN